MQLNVNQFFSDRLVLDPSKPEIFRVTNSFWDWCIRIISWICSPSSYSDENRRTIHCLKKYLIDTLGESRFKRISNRYSVDLDSMAEKGNPLLSRDVAKFVVGAKNVTVEDINEKTSFPELDKTTLSGLVDKLSNVFADVWQVPDIAKKISGRPTESLARTFYDPFLTDRERLQLCRENPKDKFPIFMHNMVARVIKRDMDVGTFVPAPNHSDGTPQFYYLSAKVVTAKGMVSYLFHPATADTDLKPIRLFRGTAARNGEIDGISTLITDFEKELGRSAYESGEIYEPFIGKHLSIPEIEGGHSLGSTIVQYRLANMNHITDAYLFCGPGLPQREFKKFNQKNPKVHLHIRHSSKDNVCLTGGAHLGDSASSNVKVDFMRYHPPRKFVESAHVAVYPKEKYYGIEGGANLFSKNRFLERVRSAILPPVAAILKIARFIARSFIASRAEKERGLKIGRIHQGRWRVDHFREI